MCTAVLAGAACADRAATPQSREEALLDFAIVRSGEDPGTPCTRPPPKASAPGDTIILDRINGFPCRAVTVQTGIELLPSEDGSRPDPNWTSIARDSRGRFYTTAARFPYGILAWNPDGSFDQVIGRAGEGPGEFGRVASVFVGAGDSVYVRHGGRWSVFDQERGFAREVRAPAFTSTREAAHFLASGLVLSTAWVDGVTDDEPFHVADLDGTVLRAFGSPPSGMARLDDGSLIFERPSLVSGPSTFWVAPERGAADGYVLEEWTIEGDLVRVLRRPVPWFEPGAGSEDPMAAQFPTFFLHQDAGGLLWVVIAVKDPRYRELRPGENDDELISELLDIRIEVIDPDAEEVLVSALLDVVPEEAGDDNTPPIAMFVRGSPLSYRMVADSVGLVTLELFETLAVRR